MPYEVFVTVCYTCADSYIISPETKSRGICRALVYGRRQIELKVAEVPHTKSRGSAGPLSKGGTTLNYKSRNLQGTSQWLVRLFEFPF